ncbi:hypothetical protein [Streptomyces griseiscabiei]|uniref:Uncharacterized protein n=1 Tax=Streptomyces griseiscabiei TaxID=2993540 RepID=A0ABU4L726_9ACTN|nr:hypothetical protein [Streptomyces griseiscabiei]MBZ3906263.1 hypothetical protein [Streptomyces griseiscabiei]MDX2911260.1 hypothetical protein [Streptomyces griseiscabiei]
MSSSRNDGSPYFRRLTAGLAVAAAVGGIIIGAVTMDKGSAQADAPWDCNRSGTACSHY